MREPERCSVRSRISQHHIYQYPYLVEIDHVVDLSSLAEGTQENTTGESQNQAEQLRKERTCGILQ